MSFPPVTDATQFCANVPTFRLILGGFVIYANGSSLVRVLFLRGTGAVVANYTVQEGTERFRQSPNPPGSTDVALWLVGDSTHA